jgi:hypothetical protein
MICTYTQSGGDGGIATHAGVKHKKQFEGQELKRKCSRKPLTWALSAVLEMEVLSFQGTCTGGGRQPHTT